MSRLVRVDHGYLGSGFGRKEAEKCGKFSGSEKSRYEWLASEKNEISSKKSEGWNFLYDKILPGEIIS